MMLLVVGVLGLLAVAAACGFAGWVVHDIRCTEKRLAQGQAGAEPLFRRTASQRFGPSGQLPTSEEAARSHARGVVMGKCVCKGLLARSQYKGWVHVDTERDDHAPIYVGSLEAELADRPAPLEFDPPKFDYTD
jgi:hypothetical protein